MGRLDRIRPYLEKLLREGFNIPDLAPDPEGDYPLRYRSAGYYVRLMNELSPTVQVFSVALRDAKRSAKLFTAVNDINAHIAYARAYVVDRQVVVATELVADTLDAEELGNACTIIGRIADKIGPELQAQFGGHVLFEDGPDQPVDGTAGSNTDEPKPNAGYL
ncbi:MAG: hypothetical protein QOK43_1275 [Acidimicrobiaceae bacterium]|nr:hypothetical protein [Acidimicrobiaceae bacterium]